MALVLLISAHGGFIYRHDRTFSLEQVSESKHAAPFVLDVVGGTRNLLMKRFFDRMLP